MARVKHSVLGGFHGMFYDLPGGARMYLAHKKRKQVYKWSWCMEVSVLDKCRAEGITAVGVLCRHQGRREVYLTHIDDFYGPHSFFRFADTKQRGLPMKQFRIDPARSEKVIAQRLRLR